VPWLYMTPWGGLTGLAWRLLGYAVWSPPSWAIRGSRA
jgi:hypothetical protein